MKSLPFVKKLAVLSLLGGGLVVSGAASAATCDSASTSGEQSLQGIFDDITVGGPSSVTANTDCLSDSADSTWAITASGGSVATMIIEIAGQANTNTFGIYDSTNSSTSVQLFNGAASAGGQVVLSIKLDGSVFVNFADTGVDFVGNSFGYYLGTGHHTFFSDTSLNGDGFDHMLAYQGTGDTLQIADIAAGVWTPNEFILAWEDLNGGGDKDYNDMVLMVESVTPVPIPAAAWLFGSGLIGLAGIARRKKTA